MELIDMTGMEKDINKSIGRKDEIYHDKAKTEDIEENINKIQGAISQLEDIMEVIKDQDKQMMIYFELAWYIFDNYRDKLGPLKKLSSYLSNGVYDEIDIERMEEEMEVWEFLQDNKKHHPEEVIGNTIEILKEWYGNEFEKERIRDKFNKAYNTILGNRKVIEDLLFLSEKKEESYRIKLTRSTDLLYSPLRGICLIKKRKSGDLWTETETWIYEGSLRFKK